MTQIEYDNVHKYLKAPSLVEIDAFINELGISDLQFERYYEMTPRTISRIRAQHIQLPRRFWHYVYEKIVPEYAVSYYKRTRSSASKNASNKPTKRKRVNVGRLKDLG